MSLENNKNNKIKYGDVAQLVRAGGCLPPSVVCSSHTFPANFNNVNSLIFKIEYRRLQQIIEYKKD